MRFPVTTMKDGLIFFSYCGSTISNCWGWIKQ